jgi:hypothetical protein
MVKQPYELREMAATIAAALASQADLAAPV